MVNKIKGRANIPEILGITDKRADEIIDKLHPLLKESTGMSKVLKKCNLIHSRMKKSNEKLLFGIMLGRTIQKNEQEIAEEIAEETLKKKLIRSLS